ncbi:hypothetical protein SLA2020_269420 [Shorea laevis]
MTNGVHTLPSLPSGRCSLACGALLVCDSGGRWGHLIGDHGQTSKPATTQREIMTGTIPLLEKSFRGSPPKSICTSPGEKIATRYIFKTREGMFLNNGNANTLLSSTYRGNTTKPEIYIDKEERRENPDFAARQARTTIDLEVRFVCKKIKEGLF